MSTVTHQPRRAPRPAHHRRHPRRHNPLTPPLLLFAAVMIAAAGYVAFVLWPRWPDAPIALDAPSLPIVVAGAAFNIEPAAIRVPVQRRAGVQERVDLEYLWPSLAPPNPAVKPTLAAPIDANDRLFVTIASGAATLPILERAKNIYPRYLAPDAAAGPSGLTVRAFRDDTPYQGEDLVFDSKTPEQFFARCARQGVTNAGTCLMERRVGDADVTFRFPRDWLANWNGVAAGIDKLLARLHRG